jgi:SNF2 family DNA or RNA helicase
MNPTEPVGEATLVVRDGRIALQSGRDISSLTAVQVFRVAIRNATELDGLPVSPRVDLSTPGITFHAQPADVVLHLGSTATRAWAHPAIRHRGEWVHIATTEDHVLVHDDWYALDQESRAAVSVWMNDHADANEASISVGAYLELYRGLSPRFRFVDELSDEAIALLSGGIDTAPGLLAQLYPYQSDGLRWLSARSGAGLGGILADEMGLGKTLQIIGLISQRRTKEPGRPSLVIVPATLMENWSRELARFAPALRVYRHLGGGRTRRPSQIGKADVVLTTYETAVIDQPVLEQVPWDVLAADEAQAIKNPETQRSIALRSLPRDGAFAVTGTPLENRTLDTWSLADFALPGYLGTRSEFASALEDEPELLSRALKPLVLRREVDQVASDLPEKIEIDVALEMFAGESQLYESVTDAIRRDRERVPILALLTKLRMFTAHPDAVYGDAPRPEERSAKLTRLLEILDELHEGGSKSLVFVAFNQPADIVVSAIQRRIGIPVWPIDGRTPVPERQKIVDQFSEVAGSAVLVLNPAAAGTGLNIQAASHVVHYTLEWNPAREAQGTARAWRRGQHRPVTVHRLFYVGSIDEVIVDRLRLKRELFDAVVQASDPDSDVSLRTLLDRALRLDLQAEQNLESHPN